MTTLRRASNEVSARPQRKPRGLGFEKRAENHDILAASAKASRHFNGFSGTFVPRSRVTWTAVVP